MQPVQLSLIPEPHPRPAPALSEQLPEQAFAAAITLLAVLIAKTAIPQRLEATGDE